MSEKCDDDTFHREFRIGQERYVQQQLKRVKGLETELQAAESKIAEMAKVLQKIEKWTGQFPRTGRTWADGSPMSYQAAFGSNGERDYMRGIARKVLAKVEAVTVPDQPAAEEEEDFCRDELRIEKIWSGKWRGMFKVVDTLTSKDICVCWKESRAQAIIAALTVKGET